MLVIRLNEFEIGCLSDAERQHRGVSGASRVALRLAARDSPRPSRASCESRGCDIRWSRYAGQQGLMIGIDHFGISARQTGSLRSGD